MMSEYENTDHTEHVAENPTGYEHQDVSMWRIGVFTFLGILVVVISLVVIVQFFAFTKEEVVQQAVLKPESISLRELRAHEDEILNTYAIVDTTGVGVYRIPIEQAMKIMADEAYQERLESEQ